MRCGTDTSRDLIQISKRVKHEGESFLTIRLPDFSKDFESCLAKGRIDPTDFQNFGKLGATPKLFRGMLDQVFDRKSGELLQRPSIEAIRCIRQVCRMFGKIRQPCHPQRERHCYEDFVAIDKEVGSKKLDISYRDYSSLYFVFQYTYGRICARLESELRACDLVPRHGPGATAERISGNRKFVLQRWPQRLEESFPSARYCISSYDKWEDLQAINFSNPSEEMPVRVISVPKTAKGPRIIAIEPVCMQYAQQSLLQRLVPLIESDPVARKITRFTSQAYNQSLALSSSRTGAYATLDMKEASDRVSLDMVCELFRSYPLLLDAILACRSQTANVPGFGVITLAKFASMGSALCFPIEAMVFSTLVVASELCRRTNGTHWKTATLTKIFKDSRYSVYGDDIIVPVEQVPSVMEMLRKFGNIVNVNKSFWTGKFRESCGVEAYDGEDVTPCYIRHPMPRNRKSMLDWSHLLTFRNQLYLKGYWHACKEIDSYINSNIGYIPTVHSTSPGVGRLTFMKYDCQRQNTHLHRPEVKTLVVRTRKRKDPLNGNPALLKFFLGKQNQITSGFASQMELERTAVSRDTYIVREWVTPY
jgi:hypothetical protein